MKRTNKLKRTKNKWDEIKKGIASSGFPFLFIIVCLLLLICGVCMNFQVMIANGGKMPVKLDIDYSDESHFSFQNNNEVEYFYFADIFNIGNTIYSLGDIIMYLSLYLYLIFFSRFLYNNILLIIKYYKKKRK